jgi:hypothetical protein
VTVNLATGTASGGDAQGDSFAGNQFENLRGGSGNDNLTGSTHRDNQIFGGGGNDTISTNLGDSAFGEAGLDSIVGSAGTGSGDSDYLDGGADADTIIGNGGTDTILGGTGNDSLLGGAQAETINGGADNDTVVGSLGNDSLAGGTGTNTLDYTGSTQAVTVNLATERANGDGIGNDTITGFGVLNTGNGADSIVGGAGSETVNAGGGNDTVSGSLGNDTLIGGSGIDSLNYGASTSAVTVDLAGNSASGAGIGTDSITGFERVITGSGNDSIVDSAANETISSGSGNDTVLAGAGEDSVNLGSGNDSFSWQDGDGDDTITLGTGADTLDLQGWNGGPNDGWDTFSGTGGATLFVNSNTGIGDGTDTLTVFGFSGNDVITCFAEGTRIATARGEVPVEQLRAGDLVVAAHGGAPLQPLVWVGRTEVNVARQRNKATVAPIVIKAGALADGVPFRDLRVSPEHAIFLDGRLVPARLLVNGTSIIQELWVRQVTYYHVELEHHGLVVSEGAVTETYFDDGNRHLFDNAKVAALAVDFEAMRGNGRYATAACAPLVAQGDAPLETIRARLAARAATVATARRA